MQTHQPRHALPKGRHARPKDPERIRQRQRNTIGGTILAMIMTVLLGSPVAQAHDGHHADAPWQVRDFDPTDGWVSAAESSVQGSFAVELSKPDGDTGTSVETNDLDLDVSSGEELQVDVNMSNSANSDGSAVRMFIYDHADADTATEGPTTHVVISGDGRATLSIPSDMTIGTMGLTYDAGNDTSGNVRFSNLRLVDQQENSTPISFLPAPDIVTPEVEFTHPDCDTLGLVTLGEVEGVQYEGAEDGQELSHGDFVEVVASVTDEVSYMIPDDVDTSFKFKAIRNPCDGQDGSDGTDGQDGQDGNDGEDGETVTVTNLPTRINTGR